jgi:LacI family transcriptional regulator, gluconate utilization system Gnt-I transcriptional repressor
MPGRRAKLHSANGLRTSRRSTQRVTLDDVALHAGVSPATVSRAVRSPELVSELTLRVIREAINATGYVPNLAASNLASNRSMTVAAIIPEISGSVFGEAVHGLEDILSPAGYQLFLGSTAYDPGHEEDLIRAFLGRRPDGLFIVGTTHTDTAAHLLRLSGIPVVETWDLTSDPIDSLVGFSNQEAMEALVAYVKERGYQHPVFAGSLQTGDFRAAKRRAAFEKAVGDLFPSEPLRVVDSRTPRVDFETGQHLFDQVRADHPESDVILFASDVFAVGAVLEARRRGINVPGDIAITGFGDIELAHYLMPTLTTVSVPNREIGLAAGKLLLDRMNKTTSEPNQIDLGYSIIGRESA